MCSHALVGVAGQTTPTNVHLWPLQSISDVVGVELDFVMLPIKRVRSGFMETAARADV